MLAFLGTLLQMYLWVVFAYIVMIWLVQFNLISMSNEIMRRLFDVFRSLVEPVLTPIRQRLPVYNGIDFSPLVLIIAIWFILSLIR